MTTHTQFVDQVGRQLEKAVQNSANESGQEYRINGRPIPPEDQCRNSTSDAVETWEEGEGPGRERHEAPWVTPPLESRFVEADTEFLVADDLAALGAVLIDTKPALAGLQGFRISYLWKKSGGSTGGKMVLGKCSKTPPMVRAYRASTFTIWLAADHAREFHLTQLQLEALLYHELCHADLEEVENEKTGEITIRPRVLAHDVEMFHSEIEEYGLWTSELKRAKDTFEQAEMPGFDVVPYGSGA